LSFRTFFLPIRQKLLLLLSLFLYLASRSRFASKVVRAVSSFGTLALFRSRFSVLSHSLPFARIRQEMEYNSFGSGIVSHIGIPQSFED